jgi:hypothetical protein
MPENVDPVSIKLEGFAETKTYGGEELLLNDAPFWTSSVTSEVVPLATVTQRPGVLDVPQPVWNPRETPAEPVVPVML